MSVEVHFKEFLFPYEMSLFVRRLHEDDEP
jgi:hypothetical protein